MSICEFPECGRKMSSSPWCAGHNKQHHQGKTLAPLKRYDSGRGCQFEGCSKPHAALGYCDGHLQQLKNNRPLSPLRVVIPIYVCSFAKCGRPHEAHGLCASHNEQQKHGRSLAPIRIPDRQASMKLASMNRRVRKKNAPGFATQEQIDARWAYYGGRCAYCGDVAVETDHKIPIALGGSGWPANLVPACRKCNARKKDKSFDQWIEESAA